jgi:CMP-N-acetylneuraminic acid synthetase
MINIAVLTGRGGSSLADKNIRLVHGKPVLAYPCIAANQSGIFDASYCSSDDDKILSAALDYGFKNIVRPEKLAADKAKHVDVINHAITSLRALNAKPQILTVLMANSATITRNQLLEAHNLLLSDHTISAVTPVIENQDHHPFRSRQLVDGHLKSYFNHDAALSSNRQELPKNYFFTHSFWMIRLVDGELPYCEDATPWEFMGDKIKPIIVDYSVDIHDLEDIAITEKWLMEHNR